MSIFVSSGVLFDGALSLRVSLNGRVTKSSEFCVNFFLEIAVILNMSQLLNMPEF